MADLIQIGVDVRTNIKQATADLDKMGGSVVNNINTINRLESEVAQLNKELTRGRVSEAAYAKGMRQINNELGLFQQRAAKAADVERKFGQAAAGGGKSLNRFNMTLQQGGYQLQDFVVQLQSGTSFFTAFSQQGSQFASIFGPKGAVIGAVIAIGSAIGGMALAMLGASKDTRTLEEALGDLSDSVDEYRDAIERANASSSEITEEFGLLSSQLRSVLKDFEELARIKVMDQLGVSIGKLRSEHISGFEGDLENIKDLLGMSGVFAAGSETVAQFNGTLKGLEDSTLSLGERLQDAFTLRDLFLENVGSIGEMNEAQKAFYNDLLTTIEQLEKFQGSALTSYDDILGSAEGLAAQEEALNEIFEARLGTIDDTANNYEDILGSAEGLAAAEEALNQLYESRLGTIDDTYNNYEDILGSAEGLAAQEQALNDLYESRLGTIDDTFNNYEDILGSEEGLQKSVDVLNQMYQDRLDKLQATADAYDDILGSEAGLLAAEKARLALTQVGDSGFGGGRGSDPREIAEGYFDALKQITEQEDERAEAAKKAAEKAAKANEKALEAAEKLREELEGPMVSAIGSVSDAFGDFIARGLQDFKGFVNQILGSFQSMIAQMIATAARNKIMLSLGLGGSTLAGQAAAGQLAGVGGASAAGPIGSFIGTFAGGGAAGTGLLGGLGTGISAFSGGIGAGFGASFGSLGTLLSGGSTVAAGGAGFAATLGAAIPAIAAVAVVVGLFSKKVKQLDSGLRVTIDSTGTLVEQFNKLQTSRLFGLIKKTNTEFTQAGADVADPIIEAIGDMQQSIIDAAGTLGIGANAFDDFSYQFKVSLKGLTEEEQLQKINEEITKMGDSFASLSGHFETMNELLAAATQRYDLETRVLQLLGNETELLIRQRERERAATHELNRGMLDQVYALEDAYSAVNSAFATVQRSIEARKNAITNSFNEIMETIQGRIEAAQAAVGVSGGILSSLEGASGTSGMTRGAGLAYLRSLRGASRISDQKKLDDALQAIAEPSQDLYTNFVDYQRDFADQSNLIRELEEKARYQLSTDEQTLLEIQNEAQAAQARYDGQIEKLDEQLDAAQEQLNALYGINTSVKDVSAAIADLSAAVQAAVSAQAAAKAALAGGGTGAGAGVQSANEAGQKIISQLGSAGVAERKSDGALFQKVNIRGSAQLLQVASDLGVKTSGKSGAEIQQAISNAGNLGVNMDNATRALQFAMGGNFGGGLRMVGERGPELEATGPSRIFSTKQTAELFRNPELVAEVKNLREEVAGLRSEQRQLQASNSKYVKRNYDINRKWDTEGLPATRT